MSTPALDIRRDRHVARVFLNRPEVRNAFNDGELAQTFTMLAADESLRCIVLGGHGARDHQPLCGELDAALRADTVRRIADIRAGAEGREGVQAFLDKRKPNWLDAQEG